MEVERHFADSLLSIHYALNRPAREPIWKRLVRCVKARKSR
jgi:hypothetical protein